MSLKKISINIQNDGGKLYCFISGFVIIVVLGGLLLWSILATLEGAVVSPGKLVVESDLKEIQHLEGGIVKEILIQEGDFVKKAQLMVLLDATRGVSELSILENDYFENLAKRARLYAEINIDDDIVFPLELTQNNYKNINETLKRQSQIFYARKGSIKNEVNINNNRIVQYQYRINGLKAQKEALEREFELVKEQNEELSGLFEKGLIAKTRIISLKQEIERLIGSIGLSDATIAEISGMIESVNLDTLKLRKSFLEEILFELQETETIIARLKDQIITSNDIIKRSKIYAPRSGRIINLKVNTIGEVVTPGSLLMNIVPIDENLVIRAYIKPDKIDKIIKGGPAWIRFTAFNKKQTPVSTAVVKNISADVIFGSDSREEYYQVTLDLTEDVSDLFQGRPLIPGMPVEVYIKTEKRNALSYFTQPFTDALSRAFNE